MRVLVTDLDRTLTGPDLRPDPRALERLQALRDVGVRVVIDSGRTLDHMLHEGLDRVSDAIVAENGAHVCVPATRTMEVVDGRFRESAQDALGPLAASFTWGRVLGSGPRVLAEPAARLMSKAGVRHAAIFNADEVMLLPAGVDKASGARLALRRLGLDPEAATVWAVGDGENDLDLFAMAQVSGAPANAPPQVREAAAVRLVEAYADGFLAFTLPLLRQDAEAARRVRVEEPEARRA